MKTGKLTERPKPSNPGHRGSRDYSSIIWHCYGTLSLNMCLPTVTPASPIECWYTRREQRGEDHLLMTFSTKNFPSFKKNLTQLLLCTWWPPNRGIFHFHHVDDGLTRQWIHNLYGLRSKYDCARSCCGIPKSITHKYANSTSPDYSVRRASRECQQRGTALIATREHHRHGKVFDSSLLIDYSVVGRPS